MNAVKSLMRLNQDDVKGPSEHVEDYRRLPSSVEEPFAPCRAAEAGYPVVAVPFALEFVIISELLVYITTSVSDVLRRNDDLLCPMSRKA